MEAGIVGINPSAARALATRTRQWGQSIDSIVTLINEAMTLSEVPCAAAPLLYQTASDGRTIAVAVRHAANQIESFTLQLDDTIREIDFTPEPLNFEPGLNTSTTAAQTSLDADNLLDTSTTAAQTSLDADNLLDEAQVDAIVEAEAHAARLQATAGDLAGTGLAFEAGQMLAQAQQILGQLGQAGLQTGPASSDDQIAVESDDDCWLNQALIASGIDPARWDPANGVDANRAIIEDVYSYYGELFLENPNLQWAGMANMVGPGLAAAFFDLDQFKDYATVVATIAEPLDATLAGAITEFAANFTTEELAWYETQFLEMQKDIFLDLAPSHEAFRQGGITAISAMYRNGQIEQPIFAAWVRLNRGIASNDQALIQEAALHMVEHEQYDVLNEHYVTMLERKFGVAVTYLMTIVATPSIPGAASFAEVFPVQIHQHAGPERFCALGACLDNPAVVSISTPLPDGNIASFDSRWALIEQDTLPAFHDVIADPEFAREVVSTPISDRVADYQLSVRTLVEVATNFEISIGN